MWSESKRWFSSDDKWTHCVCLATHTIHTTHTYMPHTHIPHTITHTLDTHTHTHTQRGWQPRSIIVVCSQNLVCNIFIACIGLFHETMTEFIFIHLNISYIYMFSYMFHKYLYHIYKHIYIYILVTCFQDIRHWLVCIRTSLTHTPHKHTYTRPHTHTHTHTRTHTHIHTHFNTQLWQEHRVHHHWLLNRADLLLVVLSGGGGGLWWGGEVRQFREALRLVWILMAGRRISWPLARWEQSPIRSRNNSSLWLGYYFFIYFLDDFILLYIHVHFSCPCCYIHASFLFRR